MLPYAHLECPPTPVATGWVVLFTLVKTSTCDEANSEHTILPPNEVGACIRPRRRRRDRKQIKVVRVQIKHKHSRVTMRTLPDPPLVIHTTNPFV